MHDAHQGLQTRCIISGLLGSISSCTLITVIGLLLLEFDYVCAPRQIPLWNDVRGKLFQMIMWATCEHMFYQLFPVRYPNLTILQAKHCVMEQHLIQVITRLMHGLFKTITQSKYWNALLPTSEMAECEVTLTYSDWSKTGGSCPKSPKSK